jgi:hypothetical protein
MNYTEELLKQPFVKDARKLLPRSPSKKWSQRDPSNLRGMCLHQGLDASASATGTAKYDCGPNHIDPKGLPGLSYTGFIERDGILWLAWNIEDKTWSQGYAPIPGDENEKYAAFCVGGDFSGQGYTGTQEPSTEQMLTIEKLWAFWKQVAGWKNNQLFGHYHFGKPACPGFTITAFIEETRAEKDWTDAKYDLEEVEGRQSALRDLGHYTGEIDGVWSLDCKFALTKFQKSVGLDPDGVWGPLTNVAVLSALG